MTPITSGHSSEDIAMTEETTTNEPVPKQGFWGRMPLWQKIIIGLVAGLVAGTIVGEDIATTWFKPIGTLFINLIKMLIVPLIFSSLVVGLCSMDDIKKMGRIGTKTFGIYSLEGIALIAGIDRILDMARTTVNVTGDAMVSILIAKGEGEIDLETYNTDTYPTGELPHLTHMDLD